MSTEDDPRRALRLDVASPCSANWEKMTGDDRMRFCALCKKNVYNLSAMSEGDKDPTEPRETMLEFPCEFPIKMMGRDEPAFHDAARQIIEKHAGKLDEDAYRKAMSRDANFVSLTVTINATSQKQLDDIYQDLSAHDEILVAL